MCQSSYTCSDCKKSILFMKVKSRLIVWMLTITLTVSRFAYWTQKICYLTKLSLIYNFTAKGWYNQSRKWYQCSEWRRFYWHENWWGLRTNSIFLSEGWTWGKLCFHIILWLLLMYVYMGLQVIYNITSISENAHNITLYEQNICSCET